MGSDPAAYNYVDIRWDILIRLSQYLAFSSVYLIFSFNIGLFIRDL